MIIETDTYDWTDYPVYLKDEEAVKEQLKKGIRTMEVYDLEADMDEQLAMTRCWAVPK